MILNLALTQGWVGREGCGVMPIRGHSSVQGGAEMGAYSTLFPVRSRSHLRMLESSVHRTAFRCRIGPGSPPSNGRGVR
jgi:predicted molibdopterin-dependent oxidoreductase YjgC